MSRRARWLVAFLSLLVAILGTAGAASASTGTADDGAEGAGAAEASTGGDDSADDDAETAPAVASLPVVTQVDATGERVELMVMTEDFDHLASTVTVVEGGQDVATDSVTTARATDRPTEIVFVVDVDNRILTGGLLDDVNRAVLSQIGRLDGNVQYGLVSAGETASIQTRLTDRLPTLQDDLLSLQASRGAAVFDAVDLAGQVFSEGDGVVRTIVVVTAGPDSASDLTAASAGAQVVQSGAQMIIVDAGGVDQGLIDLAAKVGGTTVALSGPDDVGTVMDRVFNVAGDRLLVQFDGLAETGERGSVSISFDEDQTLDFTYPAGVAASGAFRLEANTASGGSGGLFGSSIFLYLSVILAFAGISMAVWSLGSIYFAGDSLLDRRLARYEDERDELDEDEIQEMLVQSALIQRAVDLTESFAERQGFLARIESLLERANLPIRAGEALFFAAGIVTVVFAAVFLVTGNVFTGAILAIVAAAISFFAVNFMASRRLKQFEAQLPDTLQLLAGTLRAGYSLPQGLDAVSDEIADPMGVELRRAMTEAQLGRELEESLAGIADRLDSPDFAWAVMAIGIQREVGGNLNELLMTVADTMVQRERLRREVNALTAEGRVSAGILSMMPPGLGLVMYVMNPDYIGVLFSRTIGLVLIGLAFVSGLVGLLWMKKVITIDA